MPPSDACAIYEGSSDPRVTGSAQLLGASDPRITGPGGKHATMSDMVLYSLMHFIVYDLLFIILMLGIWLLIRKYLNRLARQHHASDAALREQLRELRAELRGGGGQPVTHGPRAEPPSDVHLEAAPPARPKTPPMPTTSSTPPFSQEDKKSIFFDNAVDAQFPSDIAPPPVVHGPRAQADAATAPVIHGSRGQPSIAAAIPPSC